MAKLTTKQRKALPAKSVKAGNLSPSTASKIKSKANKILGKY